MGLAVAALGRAQRAKVAAELVGDVDERADVLAEAAPAVAQAPAFRNAIDAVQQSQQELQSEIAEVQDD